MHDRSDCYAKGKLDDFFRLLVKLIGFKFLVAIVHLKLNLYRILRGESMHDLFYVVLQLIKYCASNHFKDGIRFFSTISIKNMGFAALS